MQAKDSDDDEEVVQVDRDHFMDEFFEQVRLWGGGGGRLGRGRSQRAEWDESSCVRVCRWRRSEAA